jgi:hypothetical protein
MNKDINYIITYIGTTFIQVLSISYISPMVLLG